jgi:retron-type reverse transcriptase
MKRHGNLWEKIISIENLTAAHEQAKKGKSHYTAVKKTEKDVEGNIAKVREMLLNKTFTTGTYKIEDRMEGGKLRRIYKLPYYPDRIVQHALIAVIGPIFRKSLIRDTFQSLPSRGTSDARRRVQKAMTGEDTPKYALKMDIKQYYPSIDNKKLKSIIETKIKCPDTLWLIDNVLASMPGLPIGNLTSQYFGNVYLYQFDWWVKQTLKAKHYYRYCDDIIILGNTKQELRQWYKQIEIALGDLGLTIKPDWQIYALDKQGVDFVGYVFSPNQTRIRKSIAHRFRAHAASVEKTELIKALRGFVAYKGWLMRANTKQLWRKHVTKKIIKAVNTVFLTNPIKGAI